MTQKSGHPDTLNRCPLPCGTLLVRRVRRSTTRSRRRRGCAPTTDPVRRTSTKPSAAATRCASRPVLKTGVDDLVALLKAADVSGPYVLVAHSFSGTIARVFAGEHPDEVKGIVFVDVLTPELRAQMTPEEWKIWKRINARPAKALAAYPDLERQDF